MGRYQLLYGHSITASSPRPSTWTPTPVQGRWIRISTRPTGSTNYTIFSLWDTYRAHHPLFTILQQERTADMISSMLAHYDQSVHHMLPVWSHHANENWCMIGYHAVPVIADAIVKGNHRDLTIERAAEACYDSQRTTGGMTASTITWTWLCA